MIGGNLAEGFSNHVLDMIEEGITITDYNGIIVNINAPMCKLFDLRRENIISEHISTLIGNSLSEDHLKGFYNFVTNLNKNYCPFHIKRMDTNGEWQYLDIKLNKFSSGNMDYIIAFFKDISKQIVLSKGEVRIQRTLRVLNKCTDILFYTKNFEELILEICNTIVENANYSFAWIGIVNEKPNKDVIPITFSGPHGSYLSNIKIKWDNSKYAEGPTGQSIKQKKTSIQYDIKNDQGYEIWRDEAIRNDFNSSVAIPIIIKGHIEYTINIYSSIPNAFSVYEIELLEKLASHLSFGIISLRNEELSKTSDLMLKRSEKNLINLFDNSPIGILVEKQQIIQLVNPKLIEIFGYEQTDNLIGKKVSILVAESVKNEIAERAKKRAQKIDVLKEYETIGLKKDGTEFPIKVFSNLVTFYDDTSIVTFILDLTQEKLIEAELRKREEQIVSTQKMELLGTFARGLTHDFKGILGMISLNIEYIEILLKSEEPIEEELSEIKQNIIEVDKLLTALVGFQKSVDVVNILFSPFDELADFLVWIDKLIGRNHTLQFNHGDHNVLIKGNPDQFKRVLLNLIANAREAMPNGGVINIESILLKIESNKINNPENYEFGLNKVIGHVDMEDGNKLLISVKDNGTGIDKNIIDQIFEQFFTTKESGTGIGLSMVKSIVDSMGGKISVESIKNEGTIFYIILPVSNLVD